MSLSSSVLPPSLPTIVSQPLMYKWPDPLDKIKLTEQEARVIEIFIESLKKELPPKNSSSDPYLKVKSKSKIEIDGVSHSLPRSIIIMHHQIFMLLNNKGGVKNLSGGGQQKKLKLVYELIEGKEYIKKIVSSHFEKTFFKFMRYLADDN